jgi:tetratricopeptide (TPR) repeat protein
MWNGRVKNARDLTSKAVGSAQRSDAKETAAIYEAEAALREAEIGNREQASAMARSALKLSSNRDVRVLAALVAARAGHRVAAEELVAGVENDFPLDTLVQWNWLPTIGASLALDRHNPAEAIELLKMAEPFELGLPLQAATTVALVPAYVRGQAFLALHDGRAAAAEFRKLIDHRGVIVNFVLGALARLGLARAYSLSGDTAQARVAYQEFLTLWKEADPDIPILKDAKAEYAKLQ